MRGRERNKGTGKEDREEGKGERDKNLPLQKNSGQREKGT